jgi:hypothetical protein
MGLSSLLYQQTFNFLLSIVQVHFPLTKPLHGDFIVFAHPCGNFEDAKLRHRAIR